MSAEQHWGSDWSVGVRLWVERAGRAVLGKGRLELLEGIAQHHSISAAARQMGMSYRRAWLLVQDMNAAAGTPLVETATGGSHGGGAHLTPQGQQAVIIFRTLQERLHQLTAALLPRLVQGPEAETIHVAAAVSLEEVLGQLLADYALYRPAVRVRAIFGASDELADHLLAGAPGDVLLTADTRPLERLEAARLVTPDSQMVLAENALAAIGAAESDIPVRRPGDLTQVARLVLANPASPLGGYTRRYLEQEGLYESLRNRATLVDNSRAVISAIRAGQADVGLAYGSDAAHAEGCRLLFRVRRLPVPIRYLGVVLSRSQLSAQAQELLEFLTTKQARQRFRRCGFLPVRDRNDLDRT
jgi:molybdate transport system regulatory protein